MRDVVEVLCKAMNPHIPAEDKLINAEVELAENVLNRLAAKGYTITRAAPTAPSEDAVEAIIKTVGWCAGLEVDEAFAEEFNERLRKYGYTITRAEPALISDEKLREAVAAMWRPGIENEMRTIEAALSELQARRDAESRRETMTEAELERELVDKSFSVVGGRIIGVDTAREISKKYRG